MRGVRISVVTGPPLSLATGHTNGYEWLTTSHDLTEFIQLCPDAILGKYIAVTADDSGPMTLSDAEIAEGWRHLNGIAYSPKLLHAEGLPHQGSCGHFHEWYVFDVPVTLGIQFTGNVFESATKPGHLAIFVNYLTLCLDADDELVRRFWAQMAWLQPESYLADRDTLLTFMSRDSELFSRVVSTLTAHPTSPI